MTLDARLNIVGQSGSSRNKKWHAIGYEYSRIEVDERQLPIQYAAGIRGKLRDQSLAAPVWNPPWSTKTFVHTVCDIEHHDVVSSGICADEFSDKNPREWAKQAFTTFEEALEEYMVEVMAESNI